MNTNSQEQQKGTDEVGGYNPSYNPHKHLAATDRLIHLAMDELSNARMARDMLMCQKTNDQSQSQKLADELSRTLAKVRLLQQDLSEMSTVLNTREEEIRKLRGVRDAALAELNAIDLDPTKRRIRQLLKRVHEMAPQAQFEVRKKSGRRFGVLSAMSAKGVTVITVTNQPISR